MIRAPGRTLQAQLVYLWVLVRRFKLTFFSLALLVLGGGTVMWRLYAHIGQPISWSRAVFAAYFLLFAQPTMDIPDYGPLEALFTLIPPLGIITVRDWSASPSSSSPRPATTRSGSPCSRRP